MSSALSLAIFCALCAAVSWGIADFLVAKSSRAWGPLTAAMAVNIIGASAFLLCYVALDTPPLEFSSTDAAYTIAGALFLALGQITLFKGLAIGPVSIVSPLTSVYPLITTLFAVLVLGVHLSGSQLFGIIIVVFGVLLASEMVAAYRAKMRMGSGPLYGLATAGSWGVGYVLLAQALENVAWQSVTVVQMLVIAISFIVMLPLIRGKDKISLTGLRQAFVNPFVLGAGLLQAAGMVAINLGLEQGADLAPIVAAVSACYPALTVMLALRHFQEKVKVWPLFGATLSIGGIVILLLG